MIEVFFIVQEGIISKLNLKKAFSFYRPIYDSFMSQVAGP